MRSKYYFAYGSNMNFEQMGCRCPNAVYIENAKLNHYRFIVNTRGVASIVHDYSKTVYGTLWEISESDEKSLDEYEGVQWGTYIKIFVDIELEKKELLNVMTYIADDNNIGTARDKYMEKIVTSAIERKLPEDYVEELKLWLRIKD